MPNPVTNAKSSRIIAAGAAVFVAGGALLFLAVGRSGGSSASKTRTVVSAAAPTTLPPSVYVPGAPPTTVIQFKIPEGMNAVAVPMDYFGGIGGYARPGDTINIYTSLGKACDYPPANTAVTKLLLSNVKVLEVLGSAPGATGQASAFLLALPPQEAEKVIFNQKFGSLYFTLTTGSEAPAATTGVLCQNPLK